MSIPVPHPSQLQTQTQTQMSTSSINMTAQNQEIKRLNAEIERMKNSKKEQDEATKSFMSYNQEIIKICQNLIVEKQEMQTKFEDERKLLNDCIINLQSDIGTLEKKLSEIESQVKETAEYEIQSLKTENQRLNDEVEKFSKSNAFWILKIHRFLLNSNIKYKHGAELHRMRDLVVEDYTKTGMVVGRTKDILTEYFDSKQK
jgi:hypothetical protein